MTKDAIEHEYLSESQHWIDSGSGKIGKVYVEVLGCDGLPNLDTGGFLGNKTDAFVSIVFEDSVVQTDIIDDCLSPRWLPWMKRAFVFHISHSSSQLLIGYVDLCAEELHAPLPTASRSIANTIPNSRVFDSDM
jgi:C2 domain